MIYMHIVKTISSVTAQWAVLINSCYVSRGMGARKISNRNSELQSHSVSWWLTRPFSAEIWLYQRHKVRGGKPLVKEGQQHINLNPDCLFVQQPPKKSRSFNGIGNGVNQQATYDFLLDFHCNHVFILHHLVDIVAYFPKFKEVM